MLSKPDFYPETGNQARVELPLSSVRSGKCDPCKRGVRQSTTTCTSQPLGTEQSQENSKVTVGRVWGAVGRRVEQSVTRV